MATNKGDDSVGEIVSLASSLEGSSIWAKAPEDATIAAAKELEAYCEERSEEDDFDWDYARLRAAFEWVKQSARAARECGALWMGSPELAEHAFFDEGQPLWIAPDDPSNVALGRARAETLEYSRQVNEHARKIWAKVWAQLQATK